MIIRAAGLVSHLCVLSMQQHDMLSSQAGAAAQPGDRRVSDGVPQRFGGWRRLRTQRQEAEPAQP